MMKIFVLFVVACAFAQAIATAFEDERLQGTWRVVTSKIDGVPAPSDKLRGNDIRMTFKDDEFFLRQRDDEPGNFEIKLFPPTTTNPKRIDFVGSGAIKAIYEVDGDKLKLGWPKNPLSGVPPQSFEQGQSFELLRERAASELPDLDGTWKPKFMRDPEYKGAINGVLIGDILDQRGLEIVCAGNRQFWREPGKPTTQFRFRLDATQSDNLPLRTLTLFGTKAFDVAYEYDRDTLGLFFPSSSDDNSAPADIESSGLRIVLNRVPPPQSQRLDGKWTVLSVWENSELVTGEPAQAHPKSMHFTSDVATWVNHDGTSAELRYSANFGQSPATIDFQRATRIATLCQHLGDVVKIYLPQDLKQSDRRPADFRSASFTYVLVREGI